MQKDKVIVYNTSKNTSAMDEAMGIIKAVPKAKNNTTLKNGLNNKLPYTQANVKFNNPHKKKNFNEEKEKKVKIFLDKLEEVFADIDEEYLRLKNRNYYIRTNIKDFYNCTINLRVYHDPYDKTNIITVYDEDNTLIDYIWGCKDIKAEIQYINRLVQNMASKRAKDFSLEFNPKEGLICKGTVEQYVSMKWVILDLLRDIYDCDKEMREACGL